MLSFLGRSTYRLYIIVLVVAVVIVAALALFRPLTTAIHTAAFAAQVLPSPVKPQPWLASQPVHIAAEFARDDGSAGRGDIYVIPDGKRRAGVVIFLGANAAGADDPDVINLGKALARAGFAVMYYWSPTMGERAQVDAGEIPNVVAAFDHLRRQDFVDPDRVGLAGFSVGASFALVAAADPRIADGIAFVNAFGGYYDTADLVVQIAASRAIDNGGDTPWEVDRLTRQVFNNMLTPESESPAARALLEGVDSIGEARERYRELSETFRADVDSISPSHHIDLWSPNTVMRVMHDQGDPLIPVGESRRMVRALQQQRPDVPVYYTETDIFRHVRPDANTDIKSLLGGAFQLYRHMYHIVAVAQKP
jgi:acetyl esterase/lipase